MNKILFYDPFYTGHHSEYINNVLTYFEQYPSDDKQIYVAMHRKTADILNLKDRKINKVHCVFLQEIKKGYFIHLNEIKIIAKKYDIQHVILLYFNPFFVSMALCRFDFSVSGIVFNVYNPNYERYTFLKRISKEIYYGLVSRRRKIKHLFVLNDKKSCEYLNRHFHTDKFCYLPDPVSVYEKEELPEEVLAIKKNRKIVLHFGSLSERKGTLLILNTIEILPQEILSQLSFFFIGKPSNESFNNLLKNKIGVLRKKYKEVNIFYFPHFVSNGQMESYYELSDFVLMPYLSNNMSSGVLGYAAKYQKPVITGRGLLGEIVEEYALGVAIDIDTIYLSAAISKFKKGEYQNNGIDYYNNHTIDLFIKTLITT